VCALATRRPLLKPRVGQIGNNIAVRLGYHYYIAIWQRVGYFVFSLLGVSVT